VHVLQATVRAFGARDAEILRVALVPRARQVADGELAVEQRELELVAHEDV
jgi:hypothetical protein